MISKEERKLAGRIYTPKYIVENILDLCGYKGLQILRKHIMDNSCGDGAFLEEVVLRYCEAAKSIDMTDQQLARELSEFIHGIEIDMTESEKCKRNVSRTAAKFGVFHIDWDINCGDSLSIDKYNGKMDFVVGNPPYIRVHNLKNYDLVKRFMFSKNGMTDLYIVFYEIGLKMLNENGTLGYITPSSFFNSIAGSYMREYLTLNHSIKAIVDLKHFQPFDTATTYTTIAILSSNSQDSIKYYEYDGHIKKPIMKAILSYADFCIEGAFIFGSKNTLSKLKSILSYSGGLNAFGVKNGFATLFDDFFIGDLPFDDYTIPIIKASTGHKKKCFYPYDTCGQLIPLEVLQKNTAIKMHYDKNIVRLKNRSLEKKNIWHGFGRSQGINDVGKRKVSINTLIRNTNDIKLIDCMPGTAVYSGLYILTDYDIKDIESILFSDEFILYIEMLGKYKSGGYYTFSSKDLQRFLNYKHSERIGYYGQLTLY